MPMPCSGNFLGQFQHFGGVFHVEHGRGFVHDEHAGLHAERLQNFYELLVGNGQIFNLGIQFQVDAQFVHFAAGFRLHGLVVHQAESLGFLVST